MNGLMNTDSKRKKRCCVSLIWRSKQVDQPGLQEGARQFICSGKYRQNGLCSLLPPSSVPVLCPRGTYEVGEGSIMGKG